MRGEAAENSAGGQPVVRILHEDWADPALPLPVYQTAGAAGADICANFPPETRAEGLTLHPMQRAICPTGLRVAIPDCYEMQIRPRSGLATKPPSPSQSRTNCLQNSVCSAVLLSTG